jgi:hypothetical protein
MKYHIKNVCHLTLLKLLKRRRTTLRKFLDEQNITNFESLKRKCINIGVEWPDEETFNKTQPKIVTNQSEGIIVIESPVIVQESSGKEEQELIEEQPKKYRKSRKTLEENS